MYQDKNLVCADCGAEFVFTAGEQEFHASKGFTSEPRRCPACRAARKAAANGGVRPENNENMPPRPARPMYDATCAECGKTTKVPFQPTGARPVYCSDCYRAKGGNTASRNSEGSRSADNVRSSITASPRPSSFNRFNKPAETRPSAIPRESTFDSYDFSDFSDFGGDPFGTPSNSGRNNRKRNNKRENNRERSRKEGGGRSRNRVFDDDDEMYY